MLSAREKGTEYTVSCLAFMQASPLARRREARKAKRRGARRRLGTRKQRETAKREARRARKPRTPRCVFLPAIQT
jgi:hypothetical protein